MRGKVRDAVTELREVAQLPQDLVSCSMGWEMVEGLRRRLCKGLLFTGTRAHTGRIRKAVEWPCLDPPGWVFSSCRGFESGSRMSISYSRLPQISRAKRSDKKKREKIYDLNHRKIIYHRKITQKPHVPSLSKSWFINATKSGFPGLPSKSCLNEMRRGQEPEGGHRWWWRQKWFFAADASWHGPSVGVGWLKGPNAKETPSFMASWGAARRVRKWKVCQKVPQ